MTRLAELWTLFRLLSDMNSFSPDEQAFLERFLEEEAGLRQAKKIGYLLARSGIKRVKTLGEFDWKFNPKDPQGEADGVHGPSLAERTRAIWS